MYTTVFSKLLYLSQKHEKHFLSFFFRLYVNKSFNLKRFFFRDSLNYTISKKSQRIKEKILVLLEIKVGRNNFYFLKWKNTPEEKNYSHNRY